MPLRSLGIDAFLRSHPTYDGRGVIIAVLDGGVDPGVPGLARTSTGERKLLDVRDFSGEGRVPLTMLAPATDGTVEVAGIKLSGIGRVARLAPPPFYGGVLREWPLAHGAAADVNGDGDQLDVLPFVVARASDGWVVTADTDGDGSLADEQAVHDFGSSGETIAFGRAPMTLAAKLGEENGRPLLDLFFDNSSHGTHVAGIAAGHDLFGVEGFDGVAPGAQVLALKIADNARGKISVTGSMALALEEAAEFADRRRAPLVINLSYGVGNEIEGRAVIDSILDAFAVAHPHVPVVVSAGNVGPGISTLGFPASADHAISVCALLPGVFARAPEPEIPTAPDVIGWWSARGGEVAKPDLCAPGVAYSNVPPWRTGEEISAGTSMAAPQITGAIALLQSAMAQQSRRLRAVDLKQALMATASAVPGATVIDMGAGTPDLNRAYGWLRAAHQAGVFVVRAQPDGGNTSRAAAAYRRSGLASPGDTIQRFTVTPVAGQAAARLLLTPDAPWLRAPSRVEFSGGPVDVTVTYDPRALGRPGLYVGTVWARSASNPLAGPVFGLTNTVVVPRPLEASLDTSAALDPGDLDRFFFVVPEGAGGLRVEARTQGEADVTLYLFEPGGQPYRGGSRVEARNDALSDNGPLARIDVTADALQPGVYEAVVVAPPARDAAYRLVAALPEVVVDRVSAEGVVVRNRSREPHTAMISAELMGAIRATRIAGRGADPQAFDVEVPPWARQLVVDVSLDPELWNQITDVGLTIFDQGRPIADGPLNHAFGRLSLALDSAYAGRALAVELLPAFAIPRTAATWEATVTVSLLAAEAVALPLGDQPDGTVTLEPGSASTLTLAPLPPDVPALPGFQPLLRVTAAAEGGLPSIRDGPGFEP
jgi:subtilisin family serine protease